MQLFYTSNIKGDIAILPEDEARHCTKVLRKKIGDSIQFIDGKGGLYTGIITDSNKRDCWIKISSKIEQAPRKHRIHLAIAPTKNIARIEWCIEKCTEIGIDEITFLRCDHSERTKIRIDRIHKVVLSACKQSLKAQLPIINDLTSFKTFIQQTASSSNSKYICWVSDDNSHFLEKSQYQEDMTILIGPEGDFSEKEIQLALQSNYIPVSLGDSRLRTETAGMVACHLAHIKQLV